MIQVGKSTCKQIQQEQVCILQVRFHWALEEGTSQRVSEVEKTVHLLWRAM